MYVCIHVVYTVSNVIANYSHITGNSTALCNYQQLLLHLCFDDEVCSGTRKAEEVAGPLHTRTQDAAKFLSASAGSKQFFARKNVNAVISD